MSFTEYRCFDYNPNLATERSMPPHLAGIGEDGVTFIKAECATRVFTRSVL